MAPAVRALRGATRVDADTREQVTERVQALVTAMLDRNGVVNDDLISIVITATDDIHSMFPAEAARGCGLGDVPLLCAQELNIEDKPGHCIRVLMHLNTEKARSELHHVYLQGTGVLRDDLPE
ncbi:MAG TPA: chorismate mutase [Acidimicrobiales bacterium]|nr:chorismate mutase [Acidimicrobiales bacterium]